jgi:serine/threonine protein kinase
MAMRACPQCFSPYVSDVEFCGLDGARLVVTDVDPLIGKTLDRYEILERLGHGGMSVVYRARHQVIGHEYALKLPYGEVALDRHFSERLRREAQVIAQLDHPNIVRVFDFGTTPAGSSFLLMELLRGRPLSRAIIEDGKMEPRVAARLLTQVARGLSAAHDAGFVHRDLKPGNVMLVGEKGEEAAKILDFGLVHVPDHSSMTETGVAMGTPCYMAPEQMRGEPATPQSDIYSLGAVLFEMLAGIPPFVGSLPDILVKQTQPPPPAPPSHGLENVVRAMLETNPSRRPQSVEEIIAAVERLELIEPVQVFDDETRSIRRRPAPPPPRPKNRFAAGVVLLLACAGLVLWLQRDHASAEGVVESASEKLRTVDRKLVTGMANLGERLEQKRGKDCSVRALSNRMSTVLTAIDRHRKKHPPAEVAKLEKRARALEKALGAKEISDDRCRMLGRSVSRMERDLTRVMRPARS